MTRPTILLTNDDGIESRGLRAAAEALTSLGEVTVVAPQTQWSGAGRSFPRSVSGRITVVEKEFGGSKRRAYAVDGSPAQAVAFALLEILPVPPALVVSGINNGENVGFGVTISGTVGAVLEAAASGVPALAVSQEAPVDEAGDPAGETEYAAAAYFTVLFARKLISLPPQPDVAAFKVDIPIGAGKGTPWTLTRLSRTRYYQPIRPNRKNLSDPSHIPFRIQFDPRKEEPGSDVYALHVERKVSVTPISLDLSARADFSKMESLLRDPGGRE
jgi:5'-nucleotidase